MSEGKLFKCPSCGSPLSPVGSASQIQCSYCGNQVIVPPELRDKRPTVSDLNLSESQPIVLSGSGHGGLIAGAIFLVGVIAVLLFVFAFQTMSAPPTPTPAPTARVASPTPSGFAHVVLSFGGEGTVPGLFQDPRHIAVDSNGKIYVADYKTLRVQGFDSNGKYVNGWAVDGGLCTNKPATINNLAADRSGNVYVDYCGLVVKYDGASGRQLVAFEGRNGRINDFYLGVSAIPSGDLLVWASGAPNADEVILHLDAEGKALARMPDLLTNQAGSRANAMTITPVMDGVGNLFVLNGDDYMVYKFTRDGKFVNKFGGVGTGVGQFETWAQHIALDNQSRVYVTDRASINVFDSNGVFLDKMSDRAVGGFNEFAIDDKNVIYAIGGKSTIYKLEMNGY